MTILELECAAPGCGHRITGQDEHDRAMTVAAARHFHESGRRREHAEFRIIAGEVVRPLTRAMRRRLAHEHREAEKEERLSRSRKDPL